MSKVAAPPAVPKNRLLASKEATLFKTVLQLYESRQWKRALKSADQILKKHPEHGETISMKGLVLTNMGRKDEGLDLVRKGVRLDLTSHICWHVLGLVHKADRNYEEALKCYTQALRFDKDNLNILRDAAHMQTQLRHFDALVESRQTLLKYRANVRQGWGSLAVAYHLNGQPDAAKKVLELYEKTVKDVPRYDPDHSELLLYHLHVLVDLEDYTGALAFLDTHAKDRSITDRLAISINRAKLYQKLDRIEDARQVWLTLIEGNPECYDHFRGYLSTYGSDIDSTTGASREQAISALREFSTKFPKALAPQRLLLNLLSGDEFKELAETYIRRAITGGIPSLFADVKALYTDLEKRAAIEGIVEGIRSANESGSSSDASSREPPTTLVWSWYFLAQHYATSTETLSKSLELLERAIAHTPTLPELYMTQARVLKRAGDLLGASATMTVAWRLDLQDRFLNTKNAKYLLRAGFTDEAIAMLGLFTRKSAASPGADLEDMQSLLYLLEDGDAYRRAGKLHLALKRYHGVFKVFDDHEDDQYDFHSYAMRKYTFNAYFEFLAWEDTLRSHPGYARAALEAAKIYIRLHDDPKLASPNAGLTGAAKKAAKKAKKAEAKQEETKKPAPSANADDDTVVAKDDDPEGLKLLAVPKPLEQVAKALAPLHTLRPQLLEGWIVTYDVAVRRGKFLQALQALYAAKALDAGSPELHVRIVDFRSRVNALSTPLREEVAAVVTSGLNELAPADQPLDAFNSSFLQTGAATAPRLLAVARGVKILQGAPGAIEELVFQTLHDEAHPTIQTSLDALAFLRNELQSSRADEFRAACDAKFVLSTVFKTDAEQAAIRKSRVFGIGEDKVEDESKVEEATE